MNEVFAKGSFLLFSFKDDERQIIGKLIEYLNLNFVLVKTANNPEGEVISTEKVKIDLITEERVTRFAEAYIRIAQNPILAMSLLNKG